MKCRLEIEKTKSTVINTEIIKPGQTGMCPGFFSHL